MYRGKYPTTPKTASGKCLFTLPIPTWYNLGGSEELCIIVAPLESGLIGNFWYYAIGIINKCIQYGQSI